MTRIKGSMLAIWQAIWISSLNIIFYLSAICKILVIFDRSIHKVMSGTVWSLYYNIPSKGKTWWYTDSVCRHCGAYTQKKQYLDIKMLRAYGNTPATAKLTMTATNRLAHLVGFFKPQYDEIFHLIWETAQILCKIEF